MEGVDWRNHIELTPRPVVKKSRVSVETVLATLGKGDSIESLLARAPGLTREDVNACLAYAAEALGRKAFLESFERGLEDIEAGRLTDDKDVWEEIARDRGPKDQVVSRK